MTTALLVPCLAIACCWPAEAQAGQHARQGGVAAAAGPPASQIPDSVHRARPTRDLPSSMRGVLGVRLDKDSLASVRARLGPTTEWETGDAGDAMVWWCYRVGHGRAAAIVTFGSDGEMGGEGHKVQRIIVVRADSAGPDSSRCSTSRIARPPATQGGLRLDLSPSQVRALFGAVPRRQSHSLRYSWDFEQPLSRRHPMYAYWNTHRAECCEGRAPFYRISASLTVRFDRRGAYQFVLERYDDPLW